MNYPADVFWSTEQNLRSVPKLAAYSNNYDLKKPELVMKPG